MRLGSDGVKGHERERAAESATEFSRENRVDRWLAAERKATRACWKSFWTGWTKPTRSKQEACFYLLGKTDAARRLFVVFTLLGTRVRVISASRAPKEWPRPTGRCGEKKCARKPVTSDR